MILRNKFGEILYTSKKSTASFFKEKKYLDHVVFSPEKGFSLKNTNFDDKNYFKCTFKNINFSGSVFIKCSLDFCVFENCNFYNATFDGCSFSSTSFKSCMMDGLTISYKSYNTLSSQQIVFEKCNLVQASITVNDSSYPSLIFTRCDLQSIELKGSVPYRLLLNDSFGNPSVFMESTCFPFSDYMRGCYDITAVGNKVRIGCQTKTISEWFGAKGIEVFKNFPTLKTAFNYYKYALLRLAILMAGNKYPGLQRKLRSFEKVTYESYLKK